MIKTSFYLLHKTEYLGFLGKPVEPFRLKTKQHTPILGVLLQLKMTSNEIHSRSHRFSWRKTIFQVSSYSECAMSHSMTCMRKHFIYSLEYLSLVRKKLFWCYLDKKDTKDLPCSSKTLNNKGFDHTTSTIRLTKVKEFYE